MKVATEAATDNDIVSASPATSGEDPHTARKRQYFDIAASLILTATSRGVNTAPRWLEMAAGLDVWESYVYRAQDALLEAGMLIRSQTGYVLGEAYDLTVSPLDRHMNGYVESTLAADAEHASRRQARAAMVLSVFESGSQAG